MLVQWGIDVANKSKIPCYLESSTTSHAFYLNMGFEDVDTVEIDMSRWEGEGKDVHYCMIRPNSPHS